MRYQPPVAIVLTPQEQSIADQICFDETRDENVIAKSCKSARALTLSLLGRNAVPTSRIAYFTDRAANIGSSMSRKEIFESNGTRGEDIFEHGSFLKHLMYWVNGPDLPKSCVEGICEILNHPTGTSGTEMQRQHKFLRQQVRDHELDRHRAAEEIFKLALELKLDAGTARDFRDTVRKMR